MPHQQSKPLPPLFQDDISRFWAKVDKTPGQGPAGECWGWTSTYDKDGYGRFWLKEAGQVRAHRVAFFLEHGYDSAPLCTLHECDWPPCVRGKHLKPGTNVDNLKERDRKGRQASGDRNGLRLHPERAPHGARARTAKLTAELISSIRKRHKDGVMVSVLAKENKVYLSTIYRVIRMDTWKN